MMIHVSLLQTPILVRDASFIPHTKIRPNHIVVCIFSYRVLVLGGQARSYILNMALGIFPRSVRCIKDDSIFEQLIEIGIIVY